MKTFRSLNYSMLIWISISWIACTTPKKEEPTSQSDKRVDLVSIHEAIFVKSTKLEFVTPSFCCTGCLAAVERVVVNAESPIIHSVITNIRSRKEVRLNFSKDFLKKSELDTSNQYVDLIKAYPSNPWLFIYDDDTLLQSIALTADVIDNILVSCSAKSIIGSRVLELKK